MSSYSILAKYYDRLMGDFDYQGYVDFVKDKLVGEGVDIACGSGEITTRLAKLGHRMIGIDLSQDMLNVATTKAKKLGLNIKWICQDMTQLELNHKVDFVTCVCDGMNYVDGEQIAELVQNMHKNIKTGGKFIFDISSKYKLENILGDNLFCEDYDDITYIWQNTLGENFVDMDIDFFEKIQGDTYRRIEESHRQFIHTKEFIQNLLDKDWSFEVYDGEKFAKPTSKSKRLLFVCTSK